MILWVIASISLVGILCLVAFAMLNPVMTYLNKMVGGGYLGDNVVQARAQLIWARMLLIKAIMFGMLGGMLALAIQLTPAG